MSNLSPLRTTMDPVATASPVATPVAVKSHSGGSNAQPPAPRQARTAPAPDELNSLVKEMQRKVASLSSDLQFSVDQDTGKNIVRVTERASKRIVWQFPSEDALQVTRALDQYQKGLMLNRQA